MANSHIQGKVRQNKRNFHSRCISQRISTGQPSQSEPLRNLLKSIQKYWNLIFFTQKPTRKLHFMQCPETHCCVAVNFLRVFFQPKLSEPGVFQGKLSADVRLKLTIRRLSPMGCNQLQRKYGSGISLAKFHSWKSTNCFIKPLESVEPTSHKTEEFTNFKRSTIVCWASSGSSP